MSKVRTTTIDPREIQIPDVRITAVMPDELREQFESSIGAVGAMQPPLCLKTPEGYVVVDGRNRVEAAIAAGADRIQIAYREGSLQDVLLQNLATSFLKGKPRPGDMVRVIAELTGDQGLTSDQVAERTGMTRDYTEKLMVIGQAGPEVLTSLESGAIGVTIAWILARVSDEEMRLTLLEQQLTFHWSVKDFQDHVEKALAIRQEEAAPEPPPPSAPAPEPEEECYVTGQRHPVSQLRRVWISAEGIEVLAQVKRQIAAEPAEAPAS